MMAVESMLNKGEIIACKRILYNHMLFLKRKPSPSDFLYHLTEGFLLNGKVFQHVIKVAYAEVHFSRALLIETFPNVQMFPDYLLVMLSKEKSSPDIWSRHYDLKAGLMKSNHGHVRLQSNKADYITESFNLFKDQRALCGILYPGTPLSDKIANISERYRSSGDSWETFYDEYKSYLYSNLHSYPKLNPSILLHVPLKYKVAQEVVPKGIEGFINTTTCSSEESTQEAFVKAILWGGKEVQETYKVFNPLGAISKLLKTYLEHVT